MERLVKHWNRLLGKSGGVTIPGTDGKSCGYGFMLVWISLFCEHTYTKRQFVGIVSSGVDKTPQAWIKNPSLTLPCGVF